MTDQLSDEQLWQLLDSARTNAPLGSQWKHLATGGVYRVTGHALAEADFIPLIIYEAERPGAVSWARPQIEFLDGRFARQ